MMDYLEMIEEAKRKKVADDSSGSTRKL